MTNLEKLKEVFPNAEPYHCPRCICGEIRCFNINKKEKNFNFDNDCRRCMEMFWNGEYTKYSFSERNG